MAKHCVAKLWLEPGAFWRHDLAGIGNIHELRERHREHRERDATVGLDAFHQFEPKLRSGLFIHTF